MSLGDLKRRITTIKNTSKITKAMSLISAAQLSQIKHLSRSFNPYKELIEKITSEIAYENRNRFDQDLEFITLPNEIVVESARKFLSLNANHISDTRKLIVIITSEKGLCGSFNSSAVSRVLDLVDHQTDILCIGKKGYEMLLRQQRLDKKPNILKNHYIELNLKQTHPKIVMGQITKPILQLIASNAYSDVKIVYTEFISMLKQELVVKSLFPLIIEHKPENTFDFDSKPITMLQNIIPQYLHSIIHSCILHSLQSETVKRMVTMDSSSKNSQEMLNDLSLQYNRARQTKVTMELIEVISGMQ